MAWQRICEGATELTGGRVIAVDTEVIEQDLSRLAVGLYRVN